jgi:hypothetical protein
MANTVTLSSKYQIVPARGARQLEALTALLRQYR